jgi:hypothetical protein
MSASIALDRMISGECLGGIGAGTIFGDQYFYVIAELSSLRKPVIDVRDTLIYSRVGSVFRLAF